MRAFFPFKIHILKFIIHLRDNDASHLLVLHAYTHTQHTLAYMQFEWVRWSYSDETFVQHTCALLTHDATKQIRNETSPVADWKRAKRMEI